ncbi:MAG: Smr/MutS family protein [Desulfohalobiaceae bacterium]|nr:Smr/MutS family protein [Desulfohalobiaceae bacterium]
MESRTYRLLDFFRVKEHLGGLALSVPGEKACLALQPYQDPFGLRSQTELLHQALDCSREIRDSISPFPELEGVLGRLDAGKFIEEDGFWALQVVLQQALQVNKVLISLDPVRSARLVSFFAKQKWPERTIQGLKRCLSPEGGIKDESSPELLSIRRELRRIQSQCTKRIDAYLFQISGAQYLQDNYLTISADRYVLAVKTNFKGKIQGIVHDYSQTGETCYVEPLSLVELNNRLQEIKQEERQARYQVLVYLTSLINQERETVQSTYDRMIELDVLQAKLSMAHEFEGRDLQPGGREVRLLKARHPLLFWESKDTRPLDIEFNPGQQGLIISGGNSGGKTVALKTLGLIGLMALSALPVPIEEGSSLPFWKEIHPFFGDEQSLDENLSTFTAQIEHLQAAWPGLGPDSLVLLDEFGAGTDPSQGAALAQAVLDHLLEKGAWFMAATHFPALKVYGLGNPKVRAACVLFDPGTRHPLYTIAYDQVGQSQALDVAREQGLPGEIIKQAEEYLLLDGENSERLINRLNQLAVEREKEMAELLASKRQLALEQQEWRDKKKKELQALIKESESAARTILKEWREQRTGRKQALRELDRLKKELRREIPAREDRANGAAGDWSRLDVGSPVTYQPWQKSGSIEEKDEKKQRLKVNLGGISIWASPEELCAVEKNQGPIGGTYYQHGQEASGYSLDLRGQRAEEAEANVNRFLDQAVLQGRNEFEIIHGKGTGVLKQVVREVLKRHKLVTSFFPAPENRGGDGATLVHLDSTFDDSSRS